MSFWKNTAGKNYQSIDRYDSGKGGGSNTTEFYEFEPAVVLDVILDGNHEIFKDKELTKLDYNRAPSDVEGKKPLETDVDFSWVGRALIRLVESEKRVEKEQLIWAVPLDSNISEFPLVNEMVIAVKYMNRLYYTKKLNRLNFVNSNEAFGIEQLIGGFSDGTQKGNRELQVSDQEYQGPKSKSRHSGGYGFEGVVGRYFWINKNIRAIKRYEGDLVFESRFGQSLRFSAYDDKRENDTGLKEYKDYYNSIENLFTGKPSGGGNPMIVLRNRQRPILKEGAEYKAHEKLPLVKGTKIEKNVGGYIEEDINNDGSTIAITSGMTITKWVTSCYKQMWEENKEEQTAYSPSGCSKFKFPTLDKDQIVINTDRVIISSRLAETFMYSKKRFGIVTDSEFTVDSHDQIVLNTNQKTVINSPAIYLGEYDVTDEPVLLGQTTINWMYELCNWLLAHTHWYKHSHEDAGKESPSQTQLPVQAQALIALRDKLHTLLSRRVFVTGGGLAPGKNGEKIKDGVEPVKINVGSGGGVPGQFKGKNYRPS